MDRPAWTASLVGLGRLELPTSRLSSARSNQLSYRPGYRAPEPGRQNGKPSFPRTLFCSERLSGLFNRLIPDPRSLSSESGGAERDRTDDLLLAKQALSQLSYSPVKISRGRITARERLPASTKRLLCGKRVLDRFALAVERMRGRRHVHRSAGIVADNGPERSVSIV